MNNMGRTSIDCKKTIINYRAASGVNIVKLLDIVGIATILASLLFLLLTLILLTVNAIPNL